MINSSLKYVFAHTHSDYLDVKSFLFILRKIKYMQGTLKTERKHSY